ncbi:MAG: hypothetical protein LC647_13230 [Beggiatoa sp.]|nr:hypothetical protein [Beggiatoa sp.]
MSNTLKQGAAQLKELAGTAAKVAPAPEAAPAKPPKPQKGARAKATVLIGGHFPRVVRRSLAQLQADPRNDGKKINDLLAEALNDLFAKYNVPQTAKLDRDSRA